MQTKVKKGFPPKVHTEYSPIKSQQQQLRVRVVQYSHPHIGVSPPLLDVREWVIAKPVANGKVWTGFSPNGMCLDLQAAQELHAMMPLIIERLKELQEKGK